MPLYQVIVTIEVPDIEADDPDEAIDFVRREISSVFEEPVIFTSSHAIDYNDED